MTYFGIDILPVKFNGKTELMIGEIGGIDTGRRGFNTIYLDNRVNNTVREMIKERYGNVLFNNGLFNQVFQKTGLTDPESVLEYAINNYSKELNHDMGIVKSPENSFGDELYLGQTGAVVANCINPPAGPRLVNPWLAQFAARNKVAQLSILKEFKNTIPFIDGEIYGAVDSDMRIVTGKTGKIIIKKAYGSCGADIEIITEKELLERAKTWTKTGDDLSFELKGKKLNYEVRIMQPFYETLVAKGTYGSARAVVCNETFIDAYMRISSDPIVNLARSAEPMHIERRTKQVFGELSERVVKDFLRITSRSE